MWFKWRFLWHGRISWISWAVPMWSQVSLWELETEKEMWLWKPRGVCVCERERDLKMLHHCLWKWRQEPRIKKCRQPLEAGKGKGMDCPLEPGSPTPRPLGARSYSRRRAVGEQVKLHLPLPISHITAWTLPPILPPNLRKNCLPRNQSLVPKRLGTAALEPPEERQSFKHLYFRTSDLQNCKIINLHCFKPLHFW